MPTANHKLPVRFSVKHQNAPDSGTIFPGHLSSATLAGPAWLVGGTAGPEASVIDFLALIAFFYVFHRLYPATPKNQPPTGEEGLQI